MVTMNYERNCPKCRNTMKRIPIKRLDSIMMVEFYCDECDESITFYPDFDKIKKEKATFF